MATTDTPAATDTLTAVDKPRRRRRFRSPHPGVKLKPPNAAKRMDYWRMLYTDPDTGRDVYERLDPFTHTTDKARRTSAINKARDLAERREAIANGAPRATGSSFAELGALYLDNAPHLRDSTREGYARAFRRFTEWASGAGVVPDTLTRARLLEFRTWIFKAPRGRVVKGGKRGERKPASKPRSAHTINTQLRIMRFVLAWLVVADRLPKLSATDLDVALKAYEEPPIVPEYLEPSELRDLLAAALRHDAVCFELTREERARLGYKGEGDTPRYTPIAPLVMGAVLTGMRLDELCLLDWRTHAFLDTRNHGGELMGELRLRPQDTKTKKPRTVACDVSPALRALLATLKRIGGAKGSVFGVTYDEAEAALDRLRDDYNAPPRFTWQICRSTCSSYLINAPSIYGAAAPFHAARQLGHSVAIAEKHYAGLIRGISRDARTLEAAMEIEAECVAVIKRVASPLEAGNVIELRR
jgi:integrase